MTGGNQAGEVLVEAQQVSKKFCRSLKRSLWYGVKDVAGALVPWSTAANHANGDVAGSGGLPPLRRDEFWAVENVSFELRRGECLGLIGHNGAGKSTLLKILNGLIPPDTGRITMRGRVAALIELNAGFNPILTGRENIYNQAALLGLSSSETDAKSNKIVEFAEIGDFLDMAVQNYSSGMRVRLGFAIAAQMEPDVLIIDEVLAVGDVAFRFKCLNAIGELMKSAAVIFVSHTMPQVYRLCNEVIVLNHGAVTYQGRNVADGVAVYLSLFTGSPETITGSGQVRLSNDLVRRTFMNINAENKVLLVSSLREKLAQVSWIRLKYWIRDAVRLYYRAHPRYRFHYGFVEEADTQIYLNAADVLFIPRLRVLNSGNVTLGMTFGRVVVGPDSWDVGELLRETGNPVFDPDAPETAAAAVDEGFRLARTGVIGLANRTLALSEWSVEQCADQYLRFFRDLTKSVPEREASLTQLEA